MPTYAYRGIECGHEFEVVQKFSDASLTTCPECGKPVRRVFQPVGVVFKGSGWYVNDSRSAKSTAATAASSDTKKSETSSDEKAPATAPAAKSESKAEPATKASAS
jgi:putative FmdB family regulatory protein